MGMIVTKGISVDGHTLYAIDSTTEYGTILPARNTLAVLAYVVYKKLVPEDVSPSFLAYNTEETVNIPIDVTGKDGVFHIHLFAVNKWTEGALDNGDIVFDLNDMKLKKQIAGVLTEITLASLLTEAIDPDKVVATSSTYALVTTEVTIKRDVLELEKLRLLVEYEADICEYNEYVKSCTNYDYVRTLRAAAFIEFAMPNYIAAQAKLETANVFADKVIENL